MNIKRLFQLRLYVFKAARLDAFGSRLSIAVHRITHPGHRMSGGLHMTDQSRQIIIDVLDTHAMNQRYASIFARRIQHLQQTGQPVLVHGRTDLDPHRIANTAEKFNVGTIQLRRAHTDPRKVRGQIMPAVHARHLPRQRLFVMQVQGLMRGIKLGPAQLAGLHAADDFHETDGMANLACQLLELCCQRGVLNPAQIPVFRMQQRGKAAIHQTAHKVKCHRRAGMCAQQATWIRHSGCLIKSRRVDNITTVTGQRDAIAGF